MAVIKQKTVSVGNQSQTVALKKLKNTMDSGGQHMYKVVDLNSGAVLDDAVTTKSQGLANFRQTVEDIRRGMKASKNDKRGGHSTLQDGIDMNTGLEDDLVGLEDTDGFL